MKQLTLIRHAKSSWSDPALADGERPLNKRGKKDAPLMGRVLAERGLKPDVILSSPAVRAVATAKVIAGHLGFEGKDVTRLPALYGADAEALLAVIAGLKDAHRHAMIFGHNPGLLDAANEILDSPLDRLVTCGVVSMRLPVRTWRTIRPACGTLLCYLYPKLYK